jgi:hypothetical protein
MGKLRDQMPADLPLRGATIQTLTTYLKEAGNSAKCLNRSPAVLGEEVESIFSVIKNLSTRR